MATEEPMQLGMVGLGRMGANLVRRLMRVQAIAGRTTGFSTIGRLMTADSTPNNTPSHHTMS